MVCILPFRWLGFKSYKLGWCLVVSFEVGCSHQVLPTHLLVSSQSSELGSTDLPKFFLWFVVCVKWRWTSRWRRRRRRWWWWWWWWWWALSVHKATCRPYIHKNHPSMSYGSLKEVTAPGDRKTLQPLPVYRCVSHKQSIEHPLALCFEMCTCSSNILVDWAS